MGLSLKTIKNIFKSKATLKGEELTQAVEKFDRLKPKDGDEARIVALAGNGAKVNTWDINGFSPLMEAAYKGINKAIPVLIEAGAALEAKSTDRSMIPGLTPLMWAAYAGNAAGVEALLKEGADVKATGFNGKTALHFAARTNPETIGLLLGAGADVNALSGDGRSPLFEAVLDPTKAENVKLLLAAKPSLDVTDAWSSWDLQRASTQHGGRDNPVAKLIKAAIESEKAAAPEQAKPAPQVAAPVAEKPAPAPVAVPAAKQEPVTVALAVVPPPVPPVAPPAPKAGP